MIFSICFDVTLFGREIWPVKVEDVIRLEGNDARWLDGCATLGLRIEFMQKNSVSPEHFPDFWLKKFFQKNRTLSVLRFHNYVSSCKK